MPFVIDESPDLEWFDPTLYARADGTVVVGYGRGNSIFGGPSRAFVREIRRTPPPSRRRSAGR